MASQADLISKFKDKKVFLIGDSIVDVYVYGHALGISSETPTVVAHRDSQKVSLGGAALVARNLVELGAEVFFLTLSGDDEEADWILELGLNPKQYHINLKVLRDEKRRTTVKKRYWIDGYKLLQFDEMCNDPIGDDMVEEAMYWVKKWWRASDVALVSDYRHGLMSPSLVYKLMMLQPSYNPLFIDSQISQSKGNHTGYRGADYFTLNLREAKDLNPDFSAGAGIPLEHSFNKLCHELQSENIIVKLGKNGCVAQVGSMFYQQPGFKVKTVDTCGAGDAFLAAVALGDLKNSPEETLAIANAWAALSTEVHGTDPPKFEELTTLLQYGGRR